MKKETADINASSALIRNAFDISDPDWENPVQSRMELIEKLIPILNHLLNQDMEKLLLVLYRIDVNESRVKEVLSQEEPGKISRSLAELIVDRQLEKVEFRKRYR